MKKLSLNLQTITTFLKNDFQRLASFSILFSLVKLSSFIAALWLSNLVSITNFGLFEYALSFGIIAAVPLNVGLQGAYPFFNIRAKEAGFKSLFYFHVLWVIALVVIVLIVDLVFFQQLATKIHLAVLIACIIAMQNLYSTILKSHEILLPAILLDGGLFIAINCFNACLYFGVNEFSIHTFQGLLLVYVIFLYGIYVHRFWSLKKDFSLNNYRKALHFGKHLVCSAFLIIFLTGGARILIEYYLGFEQVAYYGFYFRFAMLTVMIHQIINIVFFKKMYQADPQVLDRYFSFFVMIILGLSVFLWWLIPVLFSSTFNLLATTIENYKGLYYILSFQVVFWIVLALNENIIYREELSAQMNKGFALLLSLMLVSIYACYIQECLDVFTLTMINMIAIFFACEWQFFIMKRYKAISFFKTRLLNLFALTLFFSTYFFI